MAVGVEVKFAICSIGLVCLPTFGLNSWLNVGKYLRPMEYLGFIEHFGLKEKCFWLFLDLTFFLDHFEL